MQRLHTVSELRAALRDRNETALIPTMGNLHAGHLSLIALAKQHGRPVVASIFVNPLQFGAGEDYERYPRTLDADCAQLAEVGCDIVFAPDANELFPVPQTCTVQPPAELADDLCGAFRPGHFSGVATVVLKLFNIVQPRVAVFGRKDFQQLMVVRALIAQFNLPLELRAGATLRDADGLAMSSRNAYLSAAERIQASALYRTLGIVVSAIAAGERDFLLLTANARKHLKMAGWRVDYIEIRDADTLRTPDENTRNYVALGAAWLGKTRLVDNIELAAARLQG